jgi:hypothetical protein
MPATQATTLAQRYEMLRLVEEGHTYAAVAEQTGVSFWTARKWIRFGKRYGMEHLVSCYGRPKAEPLSGFNPLGRRLLSRRHDFLKWSQRYEIMQDNRF